MNLKLTENEQLEFKKSTSELKEAIVSICAILNKRQLGKIIFGVKNDGTVCGQDISDKSLRDVSQAISDHIEPKIYPTVTKELINDIECIVIEFRGYETPYFAYSRAYIRVSDEDKKLSAKELEILILKKNTEKVRWDNQLSDYELKQINAKELKSFVRKAKSANRLIFAYDSSINVLKKLNLTKNDQLLKAAEVLFSNHNQLELQTAIFATNDKVTFLDIKQFKGTIFKLLDDAENYIKANMHWHVKFGKLEREEIPEIPLEALREALVNSFCHRDYFAPESNKIAIYKNRIEIYNPGCFPEGLVPNDFIQGNESSVLRNPLIASTLYLSKDIEKWGSGLKRISKQCNENNVKVEFQVLKTGFMSIFYRIEELEGQDTLQESIKDTSQDTSRDTSRDTSQDNFLDKIVSACNGEMSREELQNALMLKNRSKFTINYLKPALTSGLIEPTIPEKPNSKNQKYRLTEKGIAYKKKLDNISDMY